MATGIIYDECMAEHKCLWDPFYNEKPERFTRVLQRCRELKLIERCQFIKPRNATEEELLKLHSPDIIKLLKETENVSDVNVLEEISSNYDFLYLHPSTYRLSLLAAGSTIQLVDSILGDKVRNGMAIIRPPGHHAMKSEYCGYCYFNNVALAARHALDNKQAKRILIVDWDIHHGQATQQMFYDDPRVLYFSIHGYQNGEFWPHLRESDYHFIGSGPGSGYNVNLPMNKTKMGNADYMAIFHQLLLPMAYEFNPDLVIVSAGYDAALGCPEGEMEVTPACYSHFTSSLMGLANGKIAVVLEGGYCLKSLAEGAALTLRTLLGDPCPLIAPLAAPSQSVQETILGAFYVLKNRWNFLKHVEVFSTKETQAVGSVCDGKFWPTIRFYGMDVKPLRYETRGICPLQDPELAADLDAQLDILISGTCLKVPPYRVACAENVSKNSWTKNLEIVQKCHHIPINPDSATVNELVDSLKNGKARCGVFISEDCSADVLIALTHSSQQRVLFIDGRTIPDAIIPKFFQEESNVLCVSLFASDASHQALDPAFVGLNKGKGFTVNVGLSPAVVGDGELLLATFFRVILPIAYQFSPQLVVVALGHQTENASRTTECCGQIVRLLTSLAGGRLVLFVDSRPDFTPELATSEICVKALLGYPIPMPNNLDSSPNGDAIEAIKAAIRLHCKYWSAFQFNVKLPDENVLIPPWLNDEKILLSNPQLKEM